MTLFSRAEYKFKGVEGKEDIPTENFLLACNQILPFIGELHVHVQTWLFQLQFVPFMNQLHVPFLSFYGCGLHHTQLHIKASVINKFNTRYT